MLHQALFCAVLAGIALAASGARSADSGQPQERDAQPRTRDAAEAVQEGNVTQWLEHYQRERGEDWAKQKADAEEASPPSAPASPAPTN